MTALGRTAERVSWRVVVVTLAIALNALGALGLRADFSSAGWGLLYPLSLMLLLVGVWSHRLPPGPWQPWAKDLPSQWRTAELILLGIVLLGALAMRMYRLDDWSMSVAGDEGEMGLEAVRIIAGNAPSPFLTGWHSNSNLHFWAVALTMKVFGMDLFGLRMFTVVLGQIMLLFHYLVSRLWFGPRFALISTALLGVLAVNVHFSRVGLNNIADPLFIVVSTYLLFLFLRTRRSVFLVLSAYTAAWSSFFYYGGRLAPFILGAMVLACYWLVPVAADNGAGGRAFVDRVRSGLNARVRIFWHDRISLAALLVALVMASAPFAAFAAANPQSYGARAADKLIFNNSVRLEAVLHIPHEPFAFISDAFWLRVMGSQTGATLSAFTRGDNSTFYFPNEPITNAVERGLLFLGMALAFLNWRDPRMAALLVWFWMTFFVGGVLTIDAPYVPRIVGLFPAISMFAALPISRWLDACDDLAAALPSRVARFQAGRWLNVGAASVCVALLTGLSLYNVGTYYVKHGDRQKAPNPVMVQATTVRELNEAARRAGQPSPFYINWGPPYFNHGVNQFLNYRTTGTDVANVEQAVAAAASAPPGADAVVMVWPNHQTEMPALRQLFPGSAEGSAPLPPGGPTTSLRWLLVKAG